MLLGEALLGWLDAAGVDAALVCPSVVVEQPIPGWAQELAVRVPDRVKVILGAGHYLDAPDPADQTLEEQVADAKATGHAGIRLLLSRPRSGETIARYRAGKFDRLLTAMERSGLVLSLFATWHLAVVSELAERHPGLTILLDHLGMPQAPTQELDEPPFKALPEVLALARHPNVNVKVSGAPGLSSEPYPFPDLWEPLLRIVEAFGPERLAWGTDISRYVGRIGFERNHHVPDSYPQRHSYAQALHWLRDSDRLCAADKELILGGTLQRLLGWPR